MSDEYEYHLGTCCVCEGTEGVVNIICLDRKAPVRGHGWSCVVCHLEADGAVAVLCDACLASYREDSSVLRFACRGYPGEEGRVRVGQLEGTHEHDMSYHDEIDSLVAGAAEDLGDDLSDDGTQSKGRT